MLGNRRAKLDNMILQAAKQGTEQIVPALLDKRASPEAADHEGSTPLIHASRRGYQGIVQILLNRRASPDLANLSGDTPLHVAICAGHTQVACLLACTGSVLDIHRLGDASFDAMFDDAEQAWRAQLIDESTNPKSVSSLVFCISAVCLEADGRESSLLQ